MARLDSGPKHGCKGVPIAPREVQLARQKHERHQGRLRDLARIEELKAAVRRAKPKTREMENLWRQLYDLTHKVGAPWPPAL